MVYYWEHECGWVNYLDPYYFWNFEGTVKCAGCDRVAKFKFVNGKLVEGPTEVEGEPDVLPLYADNPNLGYEAIKVGTPGKTRPFAWIDRRKSLDTWGRDEYPGKPVYGKFRKEE